MVLQYTRVYAIVLLTGVPDKNGLGLGQLPDVHVEGQGALILALIAEFAAQQHLGRVIAD